MNYVNGNDESEINPGDIFNQFFGGHNFPFNFSFNMDQSRTRTKQKKILLLNYP